MIPTKPSVLAEHKQNMSSLIDAAMSRLTWLSEQCDYTRNVVDQQRGTEKVKTLQALSVAKEQIDSAWRSLSHAQSAIQ